MNKQVIGHSHKFNSKSNKLTCSNMDASQKQHAVSKTPDADITCYTIPCTWNSSTGKTDPGSSVVAGYRE